MIAILDAAARRARDDPDAVLGAHHWLGGAIEADAATGRFDVWGASTVIDEHTGTPVIAPELFAALHARAAIDAQWPVGNAGLLHVYGYLLSTAPTPYGLKRARWLDGSLARAYGLAGDEFVPWARPSTLLERVTEATSGLLARVTTRSCTAGDLEATMALDRSTHDGAWALAYAIDGRLITTFPVMERATVLAEWDEKPERLRWNAVA